MKLLRVDATQCYSVFGRNERLERRQLQREDDACTVLYDDEAGVSLIC